MKKYLCFTTIPNRYNELKSLVDYFLDNFDIDCIKIYIPLEYIRFKNIRNLSSIIPKFTEDKYKNKVMICRVKKDHGPFTKVIGPILDKDIHDDDCLIITDDDSYKHKDWLKIMMYLLNRNKNSFIQTSNSKHTQIHGSSGFCFIKKNIKKKYFLEFINKIPKTYYFIDDDLLTIYLNIKKIKIIKTLVKLDKIHFLQEIGLGNINNRFELRMRLNDFLNKRFNFGYNYKNFY